MPTNNFKLFDENKTNILTDAEYAANTQRQNGVQTGVASSKLNNKFSYQTSLIAYAIAQIMNANGKDASDADAVATFVANLQGSLVQKVLDCASSAEAIAGVINNKFITPATMKAAALLLAGGTMTGPLYLSRDPVDPLEAATKQWVEGQTEPFSSWKKIATITTSNKGNDNAVLINPTFNFIQYSKVKLYFRTLNFSYSSSQFYIKLGFYSDTTYMGELVIAANPFSTSSKSWELKNTCMEIIPTCFSPLDGSLKRQCVAMPNSSLGTPQFFSLYCEKDIDRICYLNTQIVSEIDVDVYVGN